MTCSSGTGPARGSCSAPGGWPGRGCIKTSRPPRPAPQAGSGCGCRWTPPLAGPTRTPPALAVTVPRRWPGSPATTARIGLEAYRPPPRRHQCHSRAAVRAVDSRSEGGLPDDALRIQNDPGNWRRTKQAPPPVSAMSAGRQGPPISGQPVPGYAPTTSAPRSRSRSTRPQTARPKAHAENTHQPSMPPTRTSTPSSGTPVTSSTTEASLPATSNSPPPEPSRESPPGWP